MDTVRLGLIGIGNMGSAHVNCIGGHRIDGLELVAACDIAPERLNAGHFEEYSGVFLLLDDEDDG